MRCAGLIDAVRTAGKDDPADTRARELPRGNGVRQNLAVNGELAQPARDELRVLRAEIENEDGIVSHDTSREFAPAEGRIIVFVGSENNNTWRLFCAVALYVV